MLDASPLLKVYARWRIRELLGQNAVERQRATLLCLVHYARDTKFGRQHGFHGIASVEDYRRAVPLRRYEDFWDEYWRGPFPLFDNLTWPGRIPLFAFSSGTSGGPTKNIPVSIDMIRANRRAAIDLLVHHVAHRPHSRVLAGKNFMLGGSATLERLAGRVQGGDLSGIAAANIPWWAKPYYFPQGRLAQISDWEEKTRTLAAQSLKENIRSIAGTPSWLLLFFEELKRASRGAERLVDFYPSLELLSHGGVSFAPYRERFSMLMGGSRAELREVYPASEGFIAVADRGPDDGLRVIADNGLFLEFVPVEELDSASPVRHWTLDAEIGRNYALVLTTCAGLWAYILGDTVKIVSRSPLRLAVTGRISYSLSAFGEHLIGAEIEHAVAKAASAAGAWVTDFSVGPIYPKSGMARGHHRYLVEFSAPVNAIQVAAFGQALDRELSLANRDYADHRSGNFGIGIPEIVALRPGSFAVWMKSRGKLGGQNKVPRIVLDANAFQAMGIALRMLSDKEK